MSRSELYYCRPGSKSWIRTNPRVQKGVLELKMAFTGKIVAIIPLKDHQFMEPKSSTIYSFELKEEPTVSRPTSRHFFKVPTKEDVEIWKDRLTSTSDEDVTSDYQRKRYKLVDILGRGSFGVVHRALDTFTGCYVALKVISRALEKRSMLKSTLREMRIHHAVCDHESIVKFLDIFRIENSVFLVTELCQLDLHKLIKSNTAYAKQTREGFISMAHQLVSAIQHIHQAGIIHRDIKPSNILIDKNGRLKLCDFGMSRDVLMPTSVAVEIDQGTSNTSDDCANQENSENMCANRQITTSNGIEDCIDNNTDPLMSEYVVTRWYRAPEIILSCGRYGYQQDIWAVGCTLGEVLARRPVFPGSSYVNQIEQIVDVLGSPTAQDVAFAMTPPARRFLSKLKGQGRGLAGVIPESLFLCSSNGCQEATELDKSHRLFETFMHLLGHMLTFNPFLRISSSQALQHYLFDGIKSEAARQPRPSQAMVSSVPSSTEPILATARHAQTNKLSVLAALNMHDEEAATPSPMVVSVPISPKISVLKDQVVTSGRLTFNDIEEIEEDRVALIRLLQNEVTRISSEISNCSVVSMTTIDEQYGNICQRVQGMCRPKCSSVGKETSTCIRSIANTVGIDSAPMLPTNSISASLSIDFENINLSEQTITDDSYCSNVDLAVQSKTNTQDSSSTCGPSASDHANARTPRANSNRSCKDQENHLGEIPASTFNDSRDAEELSFQQLPPTSLFITPPRVTSKVNASTTNHTLLPSVSQTQERQSHSNERQVSSEEKKGYMHRYLAAACSVSKLFPNLTFLGQNPRKVKEPSSASKAISVHEPIQVMQVQNDDAFTFSYSNMNKEDIQMPLQPLANINDLNCAQLAFIEKFKPKYIEKPQHNCNKDARKNYADIDVKSDGFAGEKRILTSLPASNKRPSYTRKARKDLISS